MRRPHPPFRPRPARRLAAVAVALLAVASAAAREADEPPTAVDGLAQVSFAADAANTERPRTAGTRWTVVDLGTLDDGHGTSVALGIDDRREIVGVSTTADGAYHAFLWRDGRMRDLGVLPGFETGSRAVAINARGQVAGSSWDVPGERSHAFRWEHGRMRDLGTLGGAWSDATAIDDRGAVVGVSATREGEIHGFLRRHGRMLDLGGFRPVAVNGRGQIVGEGPAGVAVWEHGTLRAVDPVAPRGRALGIDPRGRVLYGLPDSPGCTRLVVLPRSGRPAPDASALRRAPCTGGNHDIELLAAINADGQVAATGDGEAFVLQRGTRSALPTLPGAQRSVAVAIDARGDIVGASGRRGHFGRSCR